MSILIRQRELIGTLSALKGSQDRFAYVVQQGGQSPPLDSALKTESYRVEGCLARVWFVPAFRDGHCYFRTDSDSAIIKGIAVLLCDLYSGISPEEILQMDPSFLESVGINQHL